MKVPRVLRAARTTEYSIKNMDSDTRLPEFKFYP